MRKKSSRRALLVVSFTILCFPVLLWRDSVHVVMKSAAVPYLPTMSRGHAVSSLVVAASDDVAVLHGGSSAELYSPGMPAVSGHLGVVASSVAPSSPATSTVPIVFSQKSIIANPAAASLAVAPGFGGGGAGSTEGGSGGIGSGGGSSASGRDFDDETCPLVSVSNPPQP